MRDEIKEFNTEEEAMKWMEDTIDDYCLDNFRFAYKTDYTALELYQDQVDHGCCGYFDETVKVGNRIAMIGCNYGH